MALVLKWVSFFEKNWYKNGSTFQVSVAHPYPNHTLVAPGPIFKYTRLALFYSLIIHCISFVYSSLPRPLSKITVARDHTLTKDFNNGLGSEL